MLERKYFSDIRILQISYSNRQKVGNPKKVGRVVSLNTLSSLLTCNPGLGDHEVPFGDRPVIVIGEEIIVEADSQGGLLLWVVRQCLHHLRLLTHTLSRWVKWG